MGQWETNDMLRDQRKGPLHTPAHLRNHSLGVVDDKVFFFSLSSSSACYVQPTEATMSVERGLQSGSLFMLKPVTMQKNASFYQSLFYIRLSITTPMTGRVQVLSLSFYPRWSSDASERGQLKVSQNYVNLWAKIQNNKSPKQLLVHFKRLLDLGRRNQTQRRLCK